MISKTMSNCFGPYRNEISCSGNLSIISEVIIFAGIRLEISRHYLVAYPCSYHSGMTSMSKYEGVVYHMGSPKRD